MLTIKSPATTANIAAGFDSFGICLDTVNTFTFDDFDGAFVINNYADTIRNKENLVIKSFLKTAEILNFKTRGLKLDIHTEVPVSRGLGSSATCITAGVAAALYYVEKEIDKNDLYYISALLEGHPDNVCPNIFGGATIAYRDNDNYKYAHFSVPQKYKFVAIIPNYELSTEKARKALPETYPTSDVVYNISRSALLVNGFINDDPQMIADGLNDKIHQPYRIPMIRDYEKIKTICLNCGAMGVYLSGAGPTVMAVTQDETAAYKIGKEFRMDGSQYNAKIMQVNIKGIEYSAY